MGDFEVTDDEIAAIGPILQRLMWASRETRARIQQYGANVLPINFYSSTPSIDEIEASFEYTSDQAPYLDSGLFNAALLRPLPYAQPGRIVAIWDGHGQPDSTQGGVLPRNFQMWREQSRSCDRHPKR